MDLGDLLGSCSKYDIFCILGSKSHGSRLNQLKSTVNSHTEYLTIHVSILDHFRHLNFDLSKSSRLKYDGSIELYDILLFFNSNIHVWPNSAALQDISL